jgi:hypothetical protein
MTFGALWQTVPKVFRCRHQATKRQIGGIVVFSMTA